MQAPHDVHRPQVLNLHAIVLDVVYEVGPALQHHTINVRGRITYAFADRCTITSVLTCLLTNAARYAPHGSRIEVETSTAPDGMARLTISDAGPGIPLPNRPNARGLGVGLAIAHDLCVRSGGRVALNDAPDGGSEFEVLFPAASPRMPTPI